ncbi:histidine phosphatase family protein [Austwickia chelonae]|uniref:histidine phosphatase family protein n=1 Tax=Austwickia chelonae TaxID=100225 RepID=UPI000E25AFA8|nr:histidine phosphatase family protein [Austwickia chelonae]
MRLLLIRHGQTSSNVIHALDTAVPGASLTELGRQQAAAVPAALAGEKVDALYVTTLVRTQQTAAPLAQERGLVARIHPGFREVSAGDLEMRTDEDAMLSYVETVFSWPSDPIRRIPGGENGHEVMERCDGLVREAAQEGLQDVAVVAHGAVIRAYAAARAHNVDAEFAAQRWLRNTGLVVLEGEPARGWEMTRWLEHPLGGEHLDGEAPADPAGAPESALE